MATLPFITTEATVIASHEGPFLHFTKLDAAVLTLFISMLLCLASLGIMLTTKIVLKALHLRTGLFVPISFLLVLTGATLLGPNVWSNLMSPFITSSYGFWVLVTGTMAIAGTVVTERRLSPQ